MYLFENLTFVQVDKSVLSAEAENTDKQKYPLCKYYCEQVYTDYHVSWNEGRCLKIALIAHHD